jgi:predicted NodU family carbamoyl transferase
MYACMANQVQQDLERVALPFFTGLRERFGFQNACFCGGVALNSVLNGRLSRECGFESVYIPPCPGVGRLLCSHPHALHPDQPDVLLYLLPCSAYFSLQDEGIAVGCAAFGLSLLQDGFPVVSGSAPVASAAATAVFPFTGSKWSADDIETELEEFEPWVVSRVVPNEKMVAEHVAEAIDSGKVGTLLSSSFRPLYTD